MNLEQARFNMVEQQVRPWSVLDATVLQTMEDIPRDVFVPEELASLAYADIEVLLGHDETMLFPRVEGRMLQELELSIDDDCLLVGTGSGYTTACIASMAKHVDSIDIYDDFLEKAANNLTTINLANFTLENKDALSVESSFDKKYDAIAVTGSVPEYLPIFEELLKPGGRLFIIVGSKPAMHALKVERLEDKFIRTTLFETLVKPLVGVKYKSAFSF
ncbi:MAG TPA: protein-L-isoaspartate O-methyltransferase [Leucothrix sp.]|nr:protein-L-isoaspartate O-methyltransferase [Leucothrix sp.]HIQ15510.1 protein-L-isoaspartate O-methyltransferase [Leucothrix sp.]